MISLRITFHISYFLFHIFPVILPIYTFDQPVLRRETSLIDSDSAGLQTLIDNMIETMHNANGIGLAANQVGKSLALTVVDVSDAKGYDDFSPIVLINPT